MTSASNQLAIDVVQRLQHAGFIAYFAGGCVRDKLMGRTPKDYDVATSAKPHEVLKLFPGSNKVGIAFGVILVRQKKHQIEVAAFRRDGVYEDGRRPDGVTFTTPEADAQRRDFTCNGLFFDPIKDELHDFVNGKADIERKLLRAIGDPRHRFAEDHLRMLRAVRFAAKLGFEIEPSTHAAISDLQDQIQRISRERIGEEVRMILEHPTRVRGIELLRAYPRLFCNIFFVAPERTARPIHWQRLASLGEPMWRPLGVMALLLDAWGTGKNVTTVIEKLRASLVFSKEEVEAFGWWAQHLPALEVAPGWRGLRVAKFKRMMAGRWWDDLARLYLSGPLDDATRAAFVARTAELAAQGVAPDPFISGDDLIRLGARPGRHFKGWLTELYDRQLEGKLVNAADAQAAAREMIARASH